MKILRLLNKSYFSIIFVIIFIFNSYAEDKPVDIWNLDNNEKSLEISNKKPETTESNVLIKNQETDIYKMQINKLKNTIKLDNDLESQSIKIVGLYDPEENGLNIDMWLNSNGDQLKNILTKLSKMNLSKDSNEIMKIILFTNSYYPTKNITEKDFLKFKSDWLIKNSNLDLIEKYLIKNQIINSNPELTKYFVDYYLSIADINKSCQLFEKNLEPLINEYLSKFYIYCLIKNGKNDEAQMIFDLKKELGFKDKYFENKINYLLGYISKVDNTISEKSILDFHLAYKTNPDFSFNPKINTSKIIWQYLSSFNLLNSFQEIDISDLEKISTIELAVHNKNYPENDLFEIYKRFQFNINQLLEAQSSFKSLTSIEARALIYQKILLESEMVEKLKYLKILKELFEKENITNAFDKKLEEFLEEIDPTKIPDNLTSFYYTNLQIKNKEDKKIKFNNDILHQSKLINYFNQDYSKSKIEKDLNNFLKKIKKNKKYILSKKDIILIESLKSDGVKIDKKYDNMYEVDKTEMPTDIQVMINNNEKAAALLRIAEVIGEDQLDRMDDDTMYFIISTLNQLNIDKIRNKILLKVLPLKV